MSMGMNVNVGGDAMNDLVAAALGKYLVAAAPNGLKKIGFEFVDGAGAYEVDIEMDDEVADRLNVFVNGQPYALITLSVMYCEYEEPASNIPSMADDTELAFDLPDVAAINAELSGENIPTADEAASGQGAETSGAPGKKKPITPKKGPAESSGLGKKD